MSRVLDAALRLRASLDTVAGALALPDETALLAAESGLATALADLGSVRHVDPADRMAIAAELRQARAALARCKILGASMSDATTLSLAAQGKAAGYDRGGVTRSRAVVRGTGLRATL
jgi:hypothetical protein